MFFGVFVMRMRSLFDVNIHGFVRVFTRLLTLHGSVDGLANGPKPVT